VVGVTTESSNVLVDPLQSLLNIEDTEVLRTVLAQLSRVGVGEDALSGVEADEDDVLTSEIRSLELDIAARTGDHSTTVHIYEDLFESDKDLHLVGIRTYRQVLVGSIGRSPNVKVQTVLILTAVRSVADSLRAGRSVGSSIENLSWFERALGNRRLPSIRVKLVIVVDTSI
jgi:hypothetical protein